MTINEIQDQIINEFSLFDDPASTGHGWMAKYEYIIEIGRELPALAEKYMTDDNLVRGCQARVWLHAEPDGNKLKFEADSDAIITKGLVAMVIRVLSGQTPADIIKSDLYFVDRIGLREHLSPGRSNGLVAMIKKMKAYALAFSGTTKTGKQ